jgi:2'-5' RNA ligase
VERRRELVEGDEGPRWAIKWAAIGDYDDDEAPPASQPARASSGTTGLSALGLVDSATAVRALAQLRHVAERQPRRRGDALQRVVALAPGGPAPAEHQRDDAEGLVSVWIGLPWPDEARGAWDAARLEAATLAGVTTDELDLRGHPPHVTVLWVGKVPADEAEAVQARVQAVLDEVLGPVDGITDGGQRQATHRQLALEGCGLGAFAPTPDSQGDTVLYLSVAGAALYALHQRLAELLLDDDEREARPWYSPHATVGYLPSELSVEQWRQLWDCTSGRGTWYADTIQLRVGRQLVNSWQLASRGS